MTEQRPQPPKYLKRDYRGAPVVGETQRFGRAGTAPLSTTAGEIDTTPQVTNRPGEVGYWQNESQKAGEPEWLRSIPATPNPRSNS